MLYRIINVVQDNIDTRFTVINSVGKISFLDSRTILDVKIWKNTFALIAHDSKGVISSIRHTAETFMVETNPSVVSFLYQELVTAAESVINPHLKELCFFALSNAEYKLIPASTRYHQCYAGGHVVHTAFLMRSALKLFQLKEAGEIDKDVVITAIIFHDFGKIHSYGIDAKTGAAFHKSEVKTHYHISLGYGEFYSACMVYGVPQETQRKVGHCILASHGRIEWGSPVEPQSKEAWLVYLADMLATRCMTDNVYLSK